MTSKLTEYEIIWPRTAYKSFDLNMEFIKRKWNNAIGERFITTYKTTCLAGGNVLLVLP